MTSENPEYFGAPELIRVMQRAAALWSLLHDDPRFSFYGRWVSVAGPQDDTARLMAGIARVVGFSSYQFCPATDFGRLSTELTAQGLDTDRWEQHWGQRPAYDAARAFLADYRPPDGVELHEISAATSAETLASIAANSIGCGVMVTSTAFMRGKAGRGMFIYATDAAGRSIASGGAFLPYHANSRFADQAFWGMLATCDEHRGQRLAVWIGAALIVRMWERHGARGFSSGVKTDNAASLAMCGRLAVNRSEFIYLTAMDRDVMGKASITR